eukprot:71518-Prymnesium_polylepis.1
MFTYEVSPVTPAVSPGSGPTDGGTLVTVTTDGVRDVPNLGCFFGGAAVAGTVVSIQQLLCSAPDLQTAASSQTAPPADATPRVASVFTQANSVSAAVLAAAPTVELTFDDAGVM